MKISFHNAFNGVKYIAAAAVVSLALTACGDDGPTKSENIEHGDKDVSSSSISKDNGENSSDSKGSSDSKNSSDSKDQSSDSGDKPSSSSSVKGDQPASSSSEKVEVPEGARAATLEDLEKNMSLGEMFGTTVYLATGAKHGLFSLWVPDTAWIAVTSDFNNGVLDISKKTGAFSSISGPAVSDSMKALYEKGLKINFVVDNEELKFSTDGGKNFQKVGTASVKTTSTKMSKGDDLKGLRLTCANGDKKNVYTFFEGRYYVETKASDKVEAWSAGYYDIQRSYLMMVPKFFEGPTSSMTTLFVEPDTYTLSFYGGLKNECEKSAVEYSDVAAKDLVNEWEAVENGYEWVFELRNSGEYFITAVKSGDTKQIKKGVWSVYGDMMFLQASGCMNASSCTQTVRGTVSGVDPKVGFEYKHSDPDEPAMPTVWTLPQYE